MTLTASQPPSATRPTVAWIETSTGVRCPIDSSVSLGRSTASHVVLTGEKVSRHHAVIQLLADQNFWLTDAGSVNGTWLNGQHLCQPTRLYDRDQLAIGSHRLIFRHPGGPTRPAPEHSLADVTIGEARTQYCWLLLAQLDSASRIEQSVAPIKMPSVMSAWLDRCKEVIEESGGRINRYLGDGLLSFWTDHDGHRSAVAQTLLALKGLQACSEPPFHVVLHYGQVNVVATATLSEENLMGAAMNFTFRMEKLCLSLKAGSLVSEVAQALLTPLLPFESAGRQPVAGFEGEHCFYGI